MNLDDRHMRAAMDLAYENVEAGGRPFAAVVVKDGRIIAKAANESHISADPTHHAEFLAVHRAGIALDTRELTDCIVYATGQPCPFCMATMSLYKVKGAVYGYSREDFAKFDTPPHYPSVELKQLRPEDNSDLYAHWKRKKESL